jgi:hypothetical protein
VPVASPLLTVKSGSATGTINKHGSPSEYHMSGLRIKSSVMAPTRRPFDVISSALQTYSVVGAPCKWNVLSSCWCYCTDNYQVSVSPIRRRSPRCWSGCRCAPRCCPMYQAVRDPWRNDVSIFGPGHLEHPSDWSSPGQRYIPLATSTLHHPRHPRCLFVFHFLCSAKLPDFVLVV